MGPVTELLLTGSNLILDAGSIIFCADEMIRPLLQYLSGRAMPNEWINTYPILSPYALKMAVKSGMNS